MVKNRRGKLNKNDVNVNWISIIAMSQALACCILTIIVPYAVLAVFLDGFVFRTENYDAILEKILNRLLDKALRLKCQNIVIGECGLVIAEDLNDRCMTVGRLKKSSSFGQKARRSSLLPVPTAKRNCENWSSYINWIWALPAFMTSSARSLFSGNKNDFY